MNTARRFAVGVVAAGILLTFGAPSNAADISVIGTTDGINFIGVEGDLQLSDVAKFRFVTAGSGPVLIVFNSAGGSLFAGIEIGEEIRKHSFGTAVVPNGLCASSCALAWLAGVPRFMDAGSKVGFHAAYVVSDGRATETGSGNAIVGAYLEKLGLDYTAIFQLTSASPNSIHWLSITEARELGIDVAILTPKQPDNTVAENAGAPNRWRSESSSRPREREEGPAPNLATTTWTDPSCSDMRAAYAEGRVTWAYVEQHGCRGDSPSVVARTPSCSDTRAAYAEARVSWSYVEAHGCGANAVQTAAGTASCSVMRAAFTEGRVNWAFVEQHGCGNR